MSDESLEIDPALERMFAVAREVAEGLGLPGDFLTSIMSQDDWSCVLKLHGVIDAALESAILKHCFANEVSVRKRDEPALARMAGGLSFEGRVSKIAFAKSFHLLSDDMLAFVKGLNQLRNAYAHRLEYVSLPVVQAVKTIDPTGQLHSKLFTMFPFALDIDSSAWRLALVIKGCCAIWQLEVRTMPALGLIAGSSDEYFRLFGRAEEAVKAI